MDFCDAQEAYEYCMRKAMNEGLGIGTVEARRRTDELMREVWYKPAGAFDVA